jgi:hypothetical protein
MTQPISFVEIFKASRTAGSAGDIIGKPINATNVRETIMNIFLSYVMRSM